MKKRIQIIKQLKMYKIIKNVRNFKYYWNDAAQRWEGLSIYATGIGELRFRELIDDFFKKGIIKEISYISDGICFNYSDGSQYKISD